LIVKVSVSVEMSNLIAKYLHLGSVGWICHSVYTPVY